MKLFLSYSLVLLLAVALMPAKAFSQQVNDKQSDEAVRQRAYKLLESLAEQISSLKSAENRVRMNSNIAESLWAHNEPRAREIFASVTKEIKAAWEDDENDPDRGRTVAVFLKLREDTAVRIGKHDPAWALSFLQETKPLSIKISDETENPLYLQLATQFAATKPDLALELGRESVKHGISPPQLGLLYELSKKSPDHALELFKELVEPIRYYSIRYDEKSQQFALMLARLFRPRSVDEPAFRDLMNHFIDVAVQSDCGKKKPPDNESYYFCYRIGLIIPLMEKADPKRTAPMKHLSRRSSIIYDWNPEFIKYADVYENGSVDDLLAMIPEYPDFRELGQSIVLRKIIESGDFARARKLVDEFSWKPSNKEEVLKQLGHEERIANEDTSAELLKEANDLPNEGETFHYLFRMATEIGTRNRQTTVKLLDRASEFLDKVPPEKWQLQYQIGIAMRYCEVKSDRCFTMMEPIIQKLNELVSAATRLNGFDNRYLRNGEWNMTAEGGVGSLLTMLAQNAGSFALYDFDRAMTLTSQFERREIRMMAQLKLAQGLLEGPPKKSLFAKDEQ